MTIANLITLYHGIQPDPLLKAILHSTNSINLMPSIYLHIFLHICVNEICYYYFSYIHTIRKIKKRRNRYVEMLEM